MAIFINLSGALEHQISFISSEEVGLLETYWVGKLVVNQSALDHI